MQSAAQTIFSSEIEIKDIEIRGRLWISLKIFDAQKRQQNAQFHTKANVSNYLRMQEMHQEHEICGKNSREKGVKIKLLILVQILEISL